MLVIYTLLVVLITFSMLLLLFLLFYTLCLSFVYNTTSYLMLPISNWHCCILLCISILYSYNSRCLRVMSFMLICNWFKWCYNLSSWLFCSDWSDKSNLLCSALILLFIILLVIYCTTSLVRVSFKLFIVLSRWSFMLLIHLSNLFFILVCYACNYSCSTRIDYCHSFNLDYNRVSNVLCLFLCELFTFYSYAVSLCYSCNSLLSMTLWWLRHYNEISSSCWCQMANSFVFSLFISPFMSFVTA